MTVKNRFFNLMVTFLLFVNLCFAQNEKYWIFFKDKGHILSKSSLQNLESQFSEKAKWRRAKVTNGENSLFDFTDLPVNQFYLDNLRSLGLQPVIVSKWLNAATFCLSPEQKQLVKNLSFVKSIRRVASGHRKPEHTEVLLTKPHSFHSDYAFDYGSSFAQNSQINSHYIHAAGYTGHGVMVAVFDSGFRLTNDVFDSINIVATWDFINDDPNVDFEEGDDLSQINHGTQVLSIIGGYSPGNLIGPAFNADFLLAKTEDITDETEIEEDFWIAAAEWADRLGADIISSSVGYMDWYEYKDMDGETAPITIAADLAFEKGIVVVTSAGNEGDDLWHYIIAPADGKQVIAVGAVDADGQIAGFSSYGPTSDGRLKPEVVAMGVRTTLAYPNGGYGKGDGTSFSCPLITGAAALVLCAHPQLAPGQVRQALIQSANRISNPDNQYGFGLVDAFRAANYWGWIVEPAKETTLVKVYPNPFSFSRFDAINFLIDLKEFSLVTIELYNIKGQHVTTLYDSYLPPGKAQMASWQGKTLEGYKIASGVYLYRLSAGVYTASGKLTFLH